MNARAKAAEVLPQTIEFKLDGNIVNAYEGEIFSKPPNAMALIFRNFTLIKATG